MAVSISEDVLFISGIESYSLAVNPSIMPVQNASSFFWGVGGGFSYWESINLNSQPHFYTIIYRIIE